MVGVVYIGDGGWAGAVEGWQVVGNGLSSPIIINTKIFMNLNLLCARP